MRILVIAVGRLKDRYLEDGFDTYLKRLRRYGKVELLRIREEKKTQRKSEKDAIEIEGKKILALVKPNDRLFAMSEEGTCFDSIQWANQMDKWMLKTTGRLIFVIGSGPGLSQTVKKRADVLLSLSPMTFPHQLALLLLLEQIYRAATILKGEPYHRP